MAEKVKLAVVLATSPVGPESMGVSGGVVSATVSITSWGPKPFRSLEEKVAASVDVVARSKA